MKVVTAHQMQAIDRKTIEEYGVPGTVLMERAGLSVVRRIKEFFQKQRAIVLAGGGNNGGDGFVVARELFRDGWNVKVYLIAKKDRLKGDALINFKIAEHFGVPIEERDSVSSEELRGCVVVDAIFGTGLKMDVKEPYRSVIENLNNASVSVVSVDIPSGISSDSGKVMGIAVKSTITVTFGLPKIGQFLYPGAMYRGRLFIEDIGFPEELLTDKTIELELLEKSTLSDLLPKRPGDAHKGNFGHVLLVAGSKGKTGAALMAAKACLRSGAGLVTIGVPASLADIFQSRVREEMILPLPDKDGFLNRDALPMCMEFIEKRANLLAIGPGLSTEEDTQSFVRALVLASPVPIVIDADGINAFSSHGEELSHAHSEVVITPHPGEMSRLTGLSIKEINAERISVAKEYSKTFNVVIALKGAPTIVATPDSGTYINSTGNPGMASAGTGDVLTGMVSGLAAQGLSIKDAARLGVYLHGLSGDIASTKLTEFSMTAGDLLDHISSAFKELRR
ncbi:MAG: NAD(P)H-hydrate dehydratase [Nitrospirae bacterium]|nr:MAG: NAD(P)H-hydrate dehydratase [Nitrospirota bacterium]